MPSMTSDAQSLSIDGRRVWLVSGAIPFARVPRGLWAARLAAAKQAGLNCIETPVVWSLHEPRPGVFDFQGDLDLRAFVQLIGQMKMYCILRPGPYVGDCLDLGGLPTWLLPSGIGKLRSAAPEFLQACSRYLAAVCERVRDLQAANPRKAPGPIVLVQNEHQWFYGHRALGNAYLGELDRFLRENGITAPIINSNNLFHSVEGEIDGWTAGTHLHANLRQLRMVRPDQPRIVIGLTLGPPGVWGKERPTPPGARSLMRRLAEVLAAGGQYNLAPFHAGTGFAFSGGRLDEGPDSFVCTGGDARAPLGEAGARGPLYDAMRRISTFASQFGRVFAALDPAYQPAVTALDGVAGAASGGPPAGLIAVDCKGSQGSIVFVFGPEAEPGGPQRTSLVLADGSTLPVDLGRQPVCWVLIGAHLVGRSTLDYCNLNAFAVVGSVFVCYGPAGAPGVMSINGSAFEVVVPEGAGPHVEEHEGVTVVVCNESTIDATLIADNAVYVGASGLDGAGQPVPHPGFKRCLRIGADGKSKATALHPPPRAAAPPALGEWSLARCDDFIGGASDRFAAIDGPASMQELGAPYGYGWLRLRIRSASTRTVKAGFFQSADRLHLYLGGSLLQVHGVGPGAQTGIVRFGLKKGEQVLTLLVDNLGRASGGTNLGEPKGLYGHAWEAAPLRAPTARLVAAEPVAPQASGGPIFGLEEADVTDARRLTWKIQHRKRTPIVMCVGPSPDPAIVLLNGEPVHVLSPGGDRLFLDPERLSRGMNVVQIAVVGAVENTAKRLRGAVSFFQGVECLTARAQWAFAKWERPAASRFRPIGRAEPGSKAPAAPRGRPAWWRTEFGVAAIDHPLFFDAGGLSKGQLYVNGHNAGRYFVATHQGKSVPPQSRYYLPEPWLKPGGKNELVLFDEHGFAPERCRLVGAPDIADA